MFDDVIFIININFNEIMIFYKKKMKPGDSVRKVILKLENKFFLKW